MGNKISLDFNHELHHGNDKNLNNVYRMNLWGLLQSSIKTDIKLVHDPLPDL